MLVTNGEVKYTIQNSKVGVKTLIAQKNKTTWYLHSSVDPIIQAQRFAELNYSSDSDILVYGLGLGYHIKALLDIMTLNQKLYVLETDKAIFDLFIQAGKSDVIKDNRLIIIRPQNLDEVDTFIRNLPVDIKILYYTPSVRAIEDRYEFLRTWLNNYRLDMNTRIYFKKMAENHNINIQLECKNFLQLFEGKYRNFPCMIVASGPSLNDVKDFIRKAKGKCILISIGRNSKFFKELEIEPTFFVEIDQHDMVAERFDIYDFSCPLVFLSTVSNKLPPIYTGPKSIVYVRKSTVDIHVVEGGGSTVAATALEIAVKMGCNPIGLIAQDLVYDGNKSHFDNSETDMNLNLMQMQLCNDGEMRYTSKSFIRHKTSLEDVISRSPENIEFFNLTSKGIRIKNSKYINPEIFLSKYRVAVNDLEKEIKTILTLERV